MVHLLECLHECGVVAAVMAAAMSAAFAPDGSLWIVALNDKRELFVQRSGDVGRSWSAPRLRDVPAAIPRSAGIGDVSLQVAVAGLD